MWIKCKLCKQCRPHPQVEAKSQSANLLFPFFPWTLINDPTHWFWIGHGVATTFVSARETSNGFISVENRNGLGWKRKTLPPSNTARIWRWYGIVLMLTSTKQKVQVCGAGGAGDKGVSAFRDGPGSSEQTGRNDFVCVSSTLLRSKLWFGCHVVVS